MKLSLGSPQSVVAETYGKPFGKWQLTPSEYSAQVGVPTGLWLVYHLTASGDRMYVTMLHFGPSESKPQQTTSRSVDSLMLMLNGHWTVSQILSDQPELAALCLQVCDVLRINNNSGNAALLFKPRTAQAETKVIYFEGDSAERPEWKSVSSLQGLPSWVYVLRWEDFDSHHTGLKKEVIGTWNPEITAHE
jgi:hypothetical protein